MKRMMISLAVVILAVAVTQADEGMWTFDNFPKDVVANARSGPSNEP